MTKTPDFFVNCYGDEESLKFKKQITGMFSVKITCEESIDSALNDGNSVSEIVEIGTNNGAYFKGLIHLKLDKILLMKEVNYKSGGGHIIIYEGSRQEGFKYFLGEAIAYDSTTGREKPFSRGTFQMNASYFFSRCGINISEMDGHR